ncbi:hypothetical protein EPUS_08686 [Endocarpon pusillum Z07020]|uniref:Myb-like domain-containing protein n=1 Tax=Endocarpon pusillum (strain Z07020 / HMAS-L-300199) TaxID=1263415 RepID=U1G2B6_ENDPU|nr:uncharacterized protein EPUS_08686 [Endocarpon pusillum Z07020]ERF71417.1 hypothetical protein EPUS_08686 [Endocarpon pusillum Z07020]
MAGTRSGRSANRKSTPLSPPRQHTTEPARDARRSTRRRAEDVCTSTERALRGASVGSEASVVSRTTRKQRAAAGPALKLSPLHEALDVNGSDSTSQIRRAAHQEETADEESDGTSAFTTKSHHEDMIFGLKALFVDSEQIVDFLNKKDFSDMLVVRSFQQLNSRGSEKLRRLLSRLRDSCEPFGKWELNDPVPFNLQDIVRKILGARYWQQVGIGQWRPDAIFQLANLANFAAAILGPSATSGQESGVLNTMLEQFPYPFTYGFEEPIEGPLRKGYSSLLEETFVVGLEIRTQLAIALFVERESKPNFDPDGVLDEVFFTEDDEKSKRFRSFNAEGLCIQERILPKRFERPVSQRIQALREHFPDNIEGMVNIRSLKISFPWENFLSQTMSWVQARADELIQQIENQGGVNKIQQSLQEKANSARNLRLHDVAEDWQRALPGANKAVASLQNVPPVSRPALPLDNSKPVKPIRKSLREEAHRFKELKALVAQESAAAEGVATATALVEEELEGSPSLGANFEDAPVSTARELLLDQNIDLSLTKEIFTSDEMKRRESNKENIDIRSRPKTFVDRQENAQKVPWGDESQETFSSTPTNRATSRKRPRTQTQDADDKEDDFENRWPANPNKRRKEIRDKTDQRKTSGRAPTKRNRSKISESVLSVVGTEDDTEYEADRDQAATDQQLADIGEGTSPLRSSHRPPPSHQPPRRTAPRSSNTHTDSPPASSAPPPSTAQQLEFMRARARDPTVAMKPRKLQTRTPYTPAEEARLIELIEEYGTSYTLIKQLDEQHEDGPLLLEKSQVQLKDKAQELKFQFLKTGAPLPANFDTIPLRNRLKEQLEALGVVGG